MTTYTIEVVDGSKFETLLAAWNSARNANRLLGGGGGAQTKEQEIGELVKDTVVTQDPDYAKGVKEFQNSAAESAQKKLALDVAAECDRLKAEVLG